MLNIPEEVNQQVGIFKPLFKKDREAVKRGMIEALRCSVWAEDVRGLRKVLLNELMLLGGENWASITLNDMPKINPVSTRIGKKVNQIGGTWFDEDAKFYSLQDVFISPLPLNIPWEKKYNICVVYACWWNHLYLKPLYYSLMSQFAYTDIHNVDVKILAGAGFIHDLGNELFHSYNPPPPQERIVWPIPDGSFYKYMITAHPILGEYDVVVVIDSDAFAYAPEGPYNFYEQLWTEYKTGKLNFTMCSDAKPATDCLWERWSRLAQRIPKDNYKEYLSREAGLIPSKLDDWLAKENWLLSCVTVIPKKCFREPGFGTYTLHQLYNDIRCDETVWLMWALSHGYKIDLLDDMKGVRWGPAEKSRQLVSDLTTGTIEKSAKLAWIHPITGDYMADPQGTRWLPPFYAELEAAAQQRYKVE